MLEEAPEAASALGLDTGPLAHLRGKLTDRSLAGKDRMARAARERLKQLEAAPREELSGPHRRDYDIAVEAHRIAVDGYRFPFGAMPFLNPSFYYRCSPYVVTQNIGAFSELPRILESGHPLNGAEDARSYLSRLEGFARALDDENAQLEHDAGLGVIAPVFLIDAALQQLRAGLALPVSQWLVVRSFQDRMKGVPGNWETASCAIARDLLIPAINRQIRVLESQRRAASDDPGSWRLPDGEAFYAWALRAATSESLDPEQLHRHGLERLSEIEGEMDGLLRGAGLTQGPVGARMAALEGDRHQRFAPGDEGRRQILDAIEAIIEDMRRRLGQAFRSDKPSAVLVRRIPIETELGAPAGYATPGAHDGSSPGTFSINLRDPSLIARHLLPTLVYHEAIPGHVWQDSHLCDLPRIRSLLTFNAAVEGWALYAEQLADEVGAFEADPFARLGYLQSIAFRAARLVVDTGLHAMRWSRREAAHWLGARSGRAESEIASEIDRYCAWPGQACGYAVGHDCIRAERADAEQQLGAQFDLRAFNDELILAGSAPNRILREIAREYIQGQLVEAPN